MDIETPLTPRQRLLVRVLHGLPASRGPVGYRLIEDERGRQRVVIDPRTAPLVRRAIMLYRNGHALRHVHRTITREGLLTNAGYPYSVSGFRKIVTNPFYEGNILFEGELYRGSHQPLVVGKNHS